MSYTPPQQILENYAKVMVHFALGNGKGIKPGDVVQLVANEAAKPLYMEMRRTIWKAGGHVIDTYLVDEDDRYNFSRDFFTLANDEQLNFFPAKFRRGLINEIDHLVFLLSDADPHMLEGIEPSKMMRAGVAMKPWMDWRREKENVGKFSWSLCLYGTPLMAKEAGLSEGEYWQQIIDACFLEEADPVQKWREVTDEIQAIAQKLTDLRIEKVHMVGEDVDLHVKIGEKRAWKAGGGSNIPSFEIFTSPDWRDTNGWIKFNQPLYRYGNLVEGIRLEFNEGVITSATATKNENVLKEMIATKNADKLGEYSLTDKRHSRITKFMAETLFDENMGGPYGNSHVAVGSSYHDCYDGDISQVPKEEWQRLGYNDSSVHTDMFTTANRTVTATLYDGSERIIYRDGQFTI